jgi:hypothetical protein
VGGLTASVFSDNASVNETHLRGHDAFLKQN